MSGLFRELIGLFVDDGRFALAIAVWVGVVAAVVAWVGQGALLGVVLFAGLAGLLAWTCVTATAAFARRGRR